MTSKYVTTWAIAAMASLSIGCGEVATSEEKAKAAAETMGWEDVRVTARHGIAPSLYGCSDKDVAAYEISGTNPAGKSASATMCCGWPFKGCTMRIP
jgi:hypothetical protein